VDDALHEALLLNTDLTLELPNLLLFLAFVDFPPLFLLLYLSLVGTHDLLLLQFKVLINLLNRPSEVLLQ
jgi:hypothetical protein